MGKHRWMALFMVAVFIAAVSFLPRAAYAVNVDLELVLLVDVSGSVDATDFALQQTGYVQAFQSASIQNAIMSGGTYHSIAATLVYWSDSAVQSVGWSLINDAASANTFAAAISAAVRPYSGGTGMTNAVNFGAGLFNNNFTGTRNVIDLSGDGSESNVCNEQVMNCLPLQNARDAALAGGVTTINALFIENHPWFGIAATDYVNAIDYANTNLIGGANAFVSIASGYPDFGAAIASKLAKEITVPEPSILLLFGAGLLGLGAAKRKLS